MGPSRGKARVFAPANAGLDPVSAFLLTSLPLMETIEERILTYPHCSTDAKREIERFVERNPEWAPLLRDVRAIEGLLPADRTDETGPSAAALSTYVVMTTLHPDRVPPALESAFERIEARLDDDPALRDRAEAMRRRLEVAEDTVAPAKQFEALTGHALSPSPEEETADIAGPADEQVGDGRVSDPSLLDTLLRLPRAARWAGAAAMVLLGVYGVLYGVSAASQSPLDRLAAIDVNDRVIESYRSTRTRSATSPTDTLRAQDLYLSALSTLHGARTSTLGLFPRYDADTLARAERLLSRTLKRTEPGSFVALEARFYLGKVHLARRELDSARTQLRIVVKREGRRADEAKQILRTLQEQARRERTAR